jgi:Lon protease-like protein
LGNERGAYGLWHARVSLLPSDIATDIPPDLQPIADELGALIAGAQKQGVEAQLPISRPYRLDECGWVANQWATLLDLNTETKTALLAEDDPLARLTQIKLLMK